MDGPTHGQEGAIFTNSAKEHVEAELSKSSLRSTYGVKRNGRAIRVALTHSIAKVALFSSRHTHCHPFTCAHTIHTRPRIHARSGPPPHPFPSTPLRPHRPHPSTLAHAPTHCHPFTCTHTVRTRPRIQPQNRRASVSISETRICLKLFFCIEKISIRQHEGDDQNRHVFAKSNHPSRPCPNIGVSFHNTKFW